MQPDRRRVLAALATGVSACLLGACGGGDAATPPAPAAPTRRYPFSLTDTQWRSRLTPAQYAVLRRNSTEFAYSSPLTKEHRPGRFHCAGCDLPVFDAKTKFDSGTGWPSFTAPLPDAVGLDRDTSYGMVRDAVHCERCGSHLGHRFDDGPPPTGQRYCINGVALTFHPA